MSEVWLGKIQTARLGWGGYQDAQFGVSFVLSGPGVGIGDFWGFWASEPDSSHQWTADTQALRFGEMAVRVRNLMRDAKVKDFVRLVGVPVEVTCERMQLKSWRVLTEVI